LALENAEEELRRANDKLSKASSDSDNSSKELEGEVSRLKKELTKQQSLTDEAEDKLADLESSFKRDLSKKDTQIASLGTSERISGFFFFSCSLSMIPEEKLEAAEAKANSSAKNDTGRADKLKAELDSVQDQLDERDRQVSQFKRQVQELTLKLDRQVRSLPVGGPLPLLTH